MSRDYDAYIICGTPRSGSTLLCEMLRGSGVAGRPHSYFRPMDIAYWADAWGVDRTQGTASPDFDRRYLSAMIRIGKAETAIFGLRIMWDSLVDACTRLNRALGVDRDVVEQFQQTFGRCLFIYISRNDKVAQAVSRVRAEQSGIWHRAADGSVLEGQAVERPVHYDGSRLAELVRELEDHDACWGTFFTDRGIAPVRLTYEAVSADPRWALQTVLAALGLDTELASQAPIPTAKLADRVSQQWVERFRHDAGTFRGP